MNQVEQSSFKAVIKLVLDWIRRRRPGPAEVDWVIEDADAPLVLDFLFTEIRFTDEESTFLPDGERILSVNGSTPPSLRPLDAALTRLAGMGGTLAMLKAENGGFNLRLAFPARTNDLVETAERIRTIQSEILKELRRDPPQ